MNIVQSYIKKLKEKGIITDEEIKKYKFEAEQGERKRREFVLEGLKKGLSGRAIAELDEDGYLTETMVKTTIKKLKNNGEVTDEEIKKWKNNRKKELQRERNKDKRRYDKKIISLLKKGYLEKEIAEELGKSVASISHRVSRLKSEGKITDEEIKEAREKRKEKEERERQESKKQEEKKKEQKEMKYEEYKEQMREILKLESRLAQKNIETFISEFVEVSKKQQEKGKLTIEELKELDDLIFMSKINIKEVLEVVRLHQKLHDYRGGLYFLNSINSFLEGEDKEKIKQVIETMKIGEKKVVALKMFREGNHTLDEIHSTTRIEHG